MFNIVRDCHDFILFFFIFRTNHSSLYPLIGEYQETDISFLASSFCLLFFKRISQIQQHFGGNYTNQQEIPNPNCVPAAMANHQLF